MAACPRSIEEASFDYFGWWDRAIVRARTEKLERAAFVSVAVRVRGGKG